MSKRTPKRASRKTIRRPGRRTSVARSPAEARLWDAFEKAVKDVEALVKQGKEGELISGDVLNFRMRGRGDDRSSGS